MAVNSAMAVRGRAALPGQGQVGRPIVIAPSLNQPMMAVRDEFPFMIGTETYPIVVGGSATLTDTFIVDGQNAFVFETIRYTASAAFRLLLAVGSRSYALMNKALHIDLVAGTAQRPGFFSEKGWMLPVGARTVMTAEFTNISTTTNTIEIAIAGHRRSAEIEKTVFTGL